MTKQQIETKEQEIRKRAKDALKKNEERYRSFYAMMPAMLHSIDANSRLLDVSDCWLERTGYKRKEVIGHKPGDFMTKESWRYAQTVTLPEFMKTGYARDIPYQFVRKNGEIFDVLLSAIAEWDENGNYTRSLAILTDITEQRNAEDALKEAQAKVEQLKYRLQAENLYLREESEVRHNFKEIISGSEALEQVMRKVEQVLFRN